MSVPSDQLAPAPAVDALSAKIVIAGGFGVGKTTFVGAISEIAPLTTEAAMTEAAAGVDDLDGVASSKTTTTVAFDFGRITIGTDIVLYLFGTPGQDRFSFMWDDLLHGALGAIVLVDTRRIEQSYPAVDYFEERSTPFAVAVNHFEGGQVYDLDEIREALGVSDHVQLMRCDARDRESVKLVIIALLRELIASMD